VTIDEVVDEGVEDAGLIEGRLEEFGEREVHEDEHEVLGEDLVAGFGELSESDLKDPIVGNGGADFVISDKEGDGFGGCTLDEDDFTHEGVD
jgi:hypothetical protein